MLDRIGGSRAEELYNQFNLFVDGDRVTYAKGLDVLTALPRYDANVDDKTVKRTTKKSKPNKRVVHVASVNVSNHMDEDVGNLKEYPVHFEFHDLKQDEKCDFFMIYIGNEKVLKCTFSNPLNERAKEVLKIAHHKCFDRQLKEKQAVISSQDKKGVRSKRKKQTRPDLQTLRQVSKNFKDLTCSEVVLRIDDKLHWNLQFQIFLHYTPQSINKFSTETSTFLDRLFSKGFNDVVPAPSSPFIQKEFIAQTVSHTKLCLKKYSDMGEASLSVNGLNIKLLPFQFKSVQWMISKELTSAEDLRTLDMTEFLNTHVSYGYEMISPKVFWNKFTNFILSSDEAQEIRSTLLRNTHGNLFGAQGLLSEEMGLGKTIEILSLILLNKRSLESDPQNTNSFVANDGKTIFRTKVSLIICPNAILQQWINEVDSHTTGFLKVFHYKGYLHVKKFFDTENITKIVQYLSQYDIIITSYNVVSMEVHYAEYNASLRPRRSISPIKYDYSSPLSLMQFFRIILDEVQMLHSDSTNAAKCTSLLHRIHTWGVSGTPIQLIRDYQTVLSYLKVSPFHELPEIVLSVNNNVIHHRDQLVNGVRFSVQELMKFFIIRDLCIRHTKKDVSSQINIPKQHNYIVPLDFAPIEWDNYLDLWHHFISASGFDQNGLGTSRLSNTQLNQWLNRLRYLCCHAIVPESNNSNKNHQSNATTASTILHNIDDVLKLMIADALDKLDFLYRENYQFLIKSAQAKMELQSKPVDAIRLLNSVKEKILKDLKDKYDVNDPFNLGTLWQAENEGKALTPAMNTEKENNLKTKVRAYLDLLHQCYFFIATGYFFLGSDKLEKVDHENEKLSLLNSDEKPKTFAEVYSTQEMEEIEKNQLLEQKYYSYAEKLRGEILFHRVLKVDSIIQEVEAYFADQGSDDQTKHPTTLNLIALDDISDYSSTLLISRCFKQLSLLISSLNEQAGQFNAFSDELQKLLYKPIRREYTQEDEDDKAQEYSFSIDDQDKMFALFACMEQLLVNRDIILTSEETVKIKKQSLKPQAGQKFSDYHNELISKLKLISGSPMRPIFDELKNSKVVRNVSNSASGNRRPEAFEDHLLQYEEHSLGMVEEGKKLRDSLRKLNVIYNAKLEYYSHLQKISDSLVSLLQLEHPGRNSLLKSLRDESREKQNSERISTAESRVKYLSSLEKLKESISNNKSFSCPICLGIIHTGAIIKCGHFFCRRCIESWLKNHTSCPMCKTSASLMEVYNFKFQNEEFETDNDSGNGEDRKPCANITSGKSVKSQDPIFKERYSNFAQLNDVHKMVIKESFGAKIDFVVKLILFLKLKAETENDGEPLQFVLYSQSTDFLKVITRVLHMHDIQSISCLANSANVGDAISRFKRYRSITCLLMNVKTLGAGLTLLNAKHIFLLDPIINRGDEQQAMGRNNRIGQTHETFVWNFMIKNSVEENIFRYKCILDGRRKLKQEEMSTEQEQAEDFSGEKEREEFEMNESTGEQVSARHLWHCFFQNIEN